MHIVWGLKKTTNGAPWLQINLAPQFLFRITIIIIIITITIITITAIFITILIVCDNRSSMAYASQPPAETLSNWLLPNHRQLHCHPDHHLGHIGITKYLEWIILKYCLTHNDGVNSPDKVRSIFRGTVLRWLCSYHCRGGEPEECLARVWPSFVSSWVGWLGA